MERLKVHQTQINITLFGISNVDYGRKNPHKTKFEDKYSYDLGILCNVIFWIHQRGIVCCGLEPEDIHSNILYYHGGYLDIGVIKKYKQYFLGEESSQLFDIFSLGILGLLQHLSVKKGIVEADNFVRKYELNKELFLTLYQDDNFIAYPSLDDFWRSCLSKNPSSRPSSFSFPLVKKTMQLPLYYPTNLVKRSNEEIMDAINIHKYSKHVYKIVMTFDLMRKVDKSNEEILSIVESFASKSSIGFVDYPVLNCNTLQMYYICDNSFLFYEAVAYLSAWHELSSVEDSFLIDYFHNYADYRCSN
jgi:hypothetical protein